MEKRINDADFIKGIMIFLMVCFHIKYSGSFTESANYATKWVYSFHMPIFLFFSGYFLSMEKSINVRFKSLFSFILVPYFLFELLYIASLYYAAKLGFKFQNQVDHLDLMILLDKIFIHPIGAYWYLHTLIISISIIYIVHWFLKENIFINILCIGFCMYLCSLFIAGFRVENGLFILLGYHFRQYKLVIPASIFSIIPIILITIEYMPNLSKANIAGLSITLLMISFLRALYLFTGHTYLSKWFSHVGRNTLIIVLIHPIFLNLMKPLYPSLLSIDHTGISYLIITTTLVIITSIWVSKVSDRFKLSKILFGRNVYQIRVSK